MTRQLVSFLVCLLSLIVVISESASFSNAIERDDDDQLIKKLSDLLQDHQPENDQNNDDENDDDLIRDLVAAVTKNNPPVAGAGTGAATMKTTSGVGVGAATTKTISGNGTSAGAGAGAGTGTGTGAAATMKNNSVVGLRAGAGAGVGAGPATTNTIPGDGTLAGAGAGVGAGPATTNTIPGDGTLAGAGAGVGAGPATTNTIPGDGTLAGASAGANAVSKGNKKYFSFNKMVSKNFRKRLGGQFKNEREELKSETKKLIRSRLKRDIQREITKDTLELEKKQYIGGGKQLNQEVDGYFKKYIQKNLRKRVIDSFGPTQTRRRGGRAYIQSRMPKGGTSSIWKNTAPAQGDGKLASTKKSMLRWIRKRPVKKKWNRKKSGKYSKLLQTIKKVIGEDTFLQILASLSSRRALPSSIRSRSTKLTKSKSSKVARYLEKYLKSDNENYDEEEGYSNK